MSTVPTDVARSTCTAESLASVLAAFSETDATAKQALQEMMVSDPAAFLRSSMPAFANVTADAGARYVAYLLWKQQLLVEELVNPARSKQHEAVQAAQFLAKIGIPLEKECERSLGIAVGQHQTPQIIARIVRILDLLTAISAPRPCVLFQGELMAHPSSLVRAHAAMLIARSGKNSGFVARLLLDPDPRVQATVVEALWNYSDGEARPLLQTAARSRIPRVAGNAIIGLYRLGDVGAVRSIFEMARQKDPGFLESAIWAMGESGDPRFLPFLIDQFQVSAGPTRMAVLRALGSIRRKEREWASADPVEILIKEAEIQPSGSRRLAVTLRSHDNRDLSLLKGTAFSISEGGALIDDYSITAGANPALLIAAFALPRFESASDPYQLAIQEGMKRALRFRRPADLWRIDRYLSAAPALKGPANAERSALPYEDALLGGTKPVRGFLNSAELLAQAIAEQPSDERSALDVASAIDRAINAMRRISGTRHLFVFLHSGGGNIVGSRRMDELRALMQEESLLPHGIAPEDAKDCLPLRELCLAVKGGTFQFAPADQVPAIVERIYSSLLNRFDILYKAPAGDGANAVCTGGSLAVSSDQGCGRAEFSFPG